jgi:hypothetical protein
MRWADVVCCMCMRRLNMEAMLKALGLLDKFDVSAAATSRCLLMFQCHEQRT